MASTQPSLRVGTRMATKSASERTNFRRWQRQRLNMPIRLVVSREDRTKIIEGRANDISEGGLLIFAGVELRGGEKLAVEFTLPFSSTPVRAPGVVRHRRGYHYGIEFGSESLSDQEQTEKFRNLLQLAAGSMSG
jgi:hypothetical protein